MKKKEKKSRTPYTDYANKNGNGIIRFLIKAPIELLCLGLAISIGWSAIRTMMPQGSFVNTVDGSSMGPTLHDGQIVFTDMSEIQRGDIITSVFPEKAILENPKEAEKVLIKRVIGLPGERVQIQDDGIYINETKLQEKYIEETIQYFTFIKDGCNDIVLAEDEYYIVGDNRRGSYDSRTFGAIKGTDILYKQSERPTENFYKKLGILVGGFILLSVVFMFIEAVFEELVFGLLYRKKARKPKVKKQRKTLIVVDMQNDFIDGALGTAEAAAIVDNVKAKINEYRENGWEVIFTRDTHQTDYLETPEGRKLPVEHCIEGTHGWEITDVLEVGKSTVINKPTFGYTDWELDSESIELVGLCTDICVVSNALLLKAKYPNTEIIVDAGCCAGVTPESHEAALTTMKMCQIHVI